MRKCTYKAFGNESPEQDYWNQDKGQREEDRPDVGTEYDSATKEEFLQGV